MVKKFSNILFLVLIGLFVSNLNGMNNIKEFFKSFVLSVTDIKSYNQGYIKNPSTSFWDRNRRNNGLKLRVLNALSPKNLQPKYYNLVSGNITNTPEEFPSIMNPLYLTEYLENKIDTSVNGMIDNVNDKLENVLKEFDKNTKDLSDNMALQANLLTDKVNNKAEKLVKDLDYRYKKAIILTSLASICVITGWYASRLIWKKIESPDLIIESSQETLFQKLKNIVNKKPKVYKNIVFEPRLKKRLDNIVAATQNIFRKISTTKTNATYRNLLLYGDPGTGKSEFSKQLALKSGMEFVIMSGASFAKFKTSESIQKMDDLFKRAKSSPKGFIIFIDEAESFLKERTNPNTSDEKYQLLTNFLNHTGRRSNKFMLVFATNHPELLDSAISRRIDDSVEMGLPAYKERVKILELYRNSVLLDQKYNSQEFINETLKNLNNKKIKEIAQNTEGFSCGELEGITNSLKTDADITDSGFITQDIIDQVVFNACEKHQKFSNNFKTAKI